MRKLRPLYLMLLIGVILAAMAISPPPSKESDVALTTFSSGRAMVDVREISKAPHLTGSPENARVRAYLESRLNALGFEVSTSSGQLNARALARLNRWSGQAKTQQDFINVIGVLPGTDRTKPALLLMAHHDTVYGSPGAADATIGLASILEITRAVQEEGPPARDIIVLFTDAEELGLNGARQFFATHSLRERIGAVINFEARGGGGTANMFQTSAKNGAAAKLYAQSVRQPSASSLSTFVYSVLPNDTDLTPALEKDYVAYNFANIGAAGYYHSPKITAEALDERSLQHMGAQGLDLSRALLSAAPLPPKTSDATFFDVFGVFTVIFAPFWGWVFIGLASLSLCLSARREKSLKDVAREGLMGTVKMLAFIILGGGALYGLNILSGAGGNYYDRLAAIPKLEFMTAALSLAVFFLIFGRGLSSQNTQMGAALPLLALAALMQFYAPTASYFLTLPMMFFGFILLAKKRNNSGAASTALAVILGAVTLGYMISLAHLLMLGVGPDFPSLAIVIAAIGVLFVGVFFEGLSKRASYTTASAALALSVIAALWIKLDPIAATVALY